MKKATARRTRNPAEAKRRKLSDVGDRFFAPDGPTRGRKRCPATDDDDIVDSDGESADASDAADGREEEVDELAAETAEERRLRLAKKYLEEIKAITRWGEGDEDEEEEEEEKRGRWDELVGKILQQEQLVESGRLRRLLASRIQKPEPTDGFRIVRKNRQPVTAVTLSEDDSKGFSASKDGIVFQWDVDSGKSEKCVWPAMEKLVSHGTKIPKSSVKWSRHVLALAVSSDGRYFATVGLDRHVHLWDTRSREHIQAFPGHRGAVSCLAFRQGTTELMSGSFDQTIQLWNAEDRAYCGS